MQLAYFAYRKDWLWQERSKSSTIESLSIVDVTRESSILARHFIVVYSQATVSSLWLLSEWFLIGNGVNVYNSHQSMLKVFTGPLRSKNRGLTQAGLKLSRVPRTRVGYNNNGFGSQANKNECVFAIRTWEDPNSHMGSHLCASSPLTAPLCLPKALVTFCAWW